MVRKKQNIRLLKLFSIGFSLLLDELELSLLLELLCLLCLSTESRDCGGRLSTGSTKDEGRLAFEGIDLAGFLHLERN